MPSAKHYPQKWSYGILSYGKKRRLQQFHKRFLRKHNVKNWRMVTPAQVLASVVTQPQVAELVPQWDALGRMNGA